MIACTKHANTVVVFQEGHPDSVIPVGCPLCDFHQRVRVLEQENNDLQDKLKGFQELDEILEDTNKQTEPGICESCTLQPSSCGHVPDNPKNCEGFVE